MKPLAARLPCTWRRLVAYRWLALAWLLFHFAAVALADQAATSAPPSPIPLTQEERAWLDEQHLVRVRAFDWPPYVITQPAPAGVAVDYIQAIARRFGFKVEFVSTPLQWPEAMADVRGPRQYFDLLPTMNRTPEREQQFALSRDYLTAPWVVYTRNDTPYIAGLESLSGLLVAAEQGYAMTDKIRTDFPAVRLLEVAGSRRALEAVATGQADAYVGNLAIANYLIKQNRFNNLVVAAPTPYGQHTQAMAVRNDWPALASLIDKGLAAMSLAEINAINQKWGAVEVRPHSDYRLVWQILAGATLVLVAFFLWNRRLAREVAVRQRIAGDLMRSEALLTEEKRHLEQAQQALQDLNQTLESQVSKRTAELASAHAFNETILLDSPVAMVVYQGRGPCVIVNQAFARLVGATREQLLAQDFRTLGTVSKTGLLDDCLKALADGQQVRREVHTRSTFGKEIWVDCLILPTRLNGEPHLLIQLFDLRAIRQASEAMSEAQARAEAANQAKSEFLANMSHEIRTPMNAILGFAQVLARDPDLKDAQREGLATIQRSGDHLLTLVNDILDMAKIEAGRMTLRVAPFNPARLLTETEGFFRQRARDRGLDLILAPANLPRWLVGDEMKLRQVLINLVGNAVKFTTAGRVIFQAVPLGADAIQFSVSDTGPGIDRSEMARLFQPFSQTATGRLKQGGTGLGLALSSQFVRLMGGEMTADSTLGQGSCFTFTLTLPPAAVAEARDPVPLPPILGLEPGQPVCRLLIVDDLADNRAPLRALLASLNPQPPVLEFREAANGEEAVALWESWQPHVILMDMRMPVLSGEEATRQIKARMAARPETVRSVVVAFSASAFNGNRDHFLACGCDEFTGKPFRAEELFAILERRAGLRFTRAGAVPTADAPLSLDEVAARLASCPAAWRADLRSAVDLGDFERITDLLANLGQTDAALHAALAQLAYNYDLEAFAALFTPAEAGALPPPPAPPDHQDVDGTALPAGDRAVATPVLDPTGPLASHPSPHGAGSSSRWRPVRQPRPARRTQPEE
jgi:two-component system sensor histidine kinase/response regulator